MIISSNSKRRNRAFSISEVTIALAICSIGLLITVGLLPSIIDQLSDSADRNAYARIKQSLSARYAMMDWGALEDSFRAGTVERFYFDFSGTEVEKDSFDAIYATEVQIGQRRTLPGDDTHNRFIRSLDIKVTQALLREDAFTNPDFYDTLTTSLGNENKLSNAYRD